MQNIPLTLVSEKPLFPYHYGRDLKPYVESIRSHGLLNPVWALQQPEGFRIIDGFLRFQAARQLSYETLACRVTTEVPVDLFWQGFEINRWGCQFNCVEKALIIEQARQIPNWHERQEDLFRVLDIKGRPQLQFLKKLLTSSDAVLTLLSEENWTPQCVAKLMAFNPDEIERLVLHLQNLTLNQNKLSEILEWFFEVLRRDQQSVDSLWDEIIAGCPVTQDSFRHVEHLREKLKIKRFPRWQAREHEFRQRVGGLRLPSHVSVRPEAFFERPGVEFVARIGSKVDRDQIIEILGKKEFDRALES